MINSDVKKQEFYKALIEKNSNYDGIFFVGVKTTGVFCHATCTAKKPKFENCNFFSSAEEALLEGYRPCKICNPLSYPNEIPQEIKLLIKEVESYPEKRWQEKDFVLLGLNSFSARRKFKNIYGMTFVQYARARRMGLAFHEISKGSKVIEQQLATGYESSSGFNDAFTKIMGNPAKKTKIKVIYSCFIYTPIGRMISMSDKNYLYLLEFVDRRGLEKEIEKLRNKHNARIIYCENNINKNLEEQLNLYFKQQLSHFTIPLFYYGTKFQQEVWNILKSIPIGDTMSYQDIALKIGGKNKVRAIGNANGANQISILIPCHRVIKSNGDLGGYGGGVERKKYLLNLEKEIDK